jgi:hypothetical protein
MQAVDDSFLLPGQDLFLVDEIAILVLASEEERNNGDSSPLSF